MIPLLLRHYLFGLGIILTLIVVVESVICWDSWEAISCQFVLQMTFTLTRLTLIHFSWACFPRRGYFCFQNTFIFVIQIAYSDIWPLKSFNLAFQVTICLLSNMLSLGLVAFLRHQTLIIFAWHHYWAPNNYWILVFTYALLLLLIGYYSICVIVIHNFCLSWIIYFCFYK